MSPRRVIGIDAGGTKLLGGVVDEGLAVRHRVHRLWQGSDRQELLRVMVEAVEEARAAAPDAAAVGFGIPSLVDLATGASMFSVHLPLDGVPFRALMEERLNLPVVVDNDANLALLAEARAGAARDRRHALMLTIGTGIGTGIVFDGKIYHGRTGSAGEGGHVSIDYQGPICRCGKPGCIEILASGTAIAQRARQELAAGATSAMLELARGDLAAFTGEIVGKAAESGDALAIRILSEATEMLALWLSNIVDLFDPDVIVIGGGAAALYRPFFAKLHERISQLTVNPHANEVPIVSARYGADSGIAGGAAFCT